MLSPFECGYGIKHKTSKSTKKIATITTVPHLIREEGISPKRVLTFSERNSMLSFFFGGVI